MKKNSHAVCQVASWLKACKIEFHRDYHSKHDLAVLAKDGAKLLVQISEEEAAGCLRVSPEEVTHRDWDRALKAFHVITTAAGYGRPVPVNRGAAPSKKASFGQDWDLIAMRHNEFRRAPNPSHEDLDKYRTIIRGMAAEFKRLNGPFCTYNSYDYEDLKSWATVWTINFLAHYEGQNEDDNNPGKLTHYLRQRFHELRTLTFRRQPPPTLYMDDANLQGPELLDETEAEPELDLDTVLREMPYSEIVPILTKIIGDSSLDRETRELAKEKLKELNSQN